MYSWGVVDSASCVLCATGNETHDHLFFSCPFSSTVWQHFLAKNNIHRPCLDLKYEVQWIREHRGGANLQHFLVKLSCTAAIYHMWRERNWHIFQSKCTDPHQVIKEVTSDIRCYVSSWRNIRRSDVNRLICFEWNLSAKVFAAS